MAPARPAAVKLLHTSDWHLGARLGRHDRQPDHVAALRGLLDVVAREQPDLILHTGDLFDATRPPYEALQLGVTALQRLAAAAPTVVVCGNHDSPALLRVLHDLAGMATPRRLWFVTDPQVLEPGGDQPGSALDGVAIACVPFIAPSALADVVAGDLATFAGTYADGVRDLNELLLARAEAAAGRDGIVLYAAHLHVHGAQPGRSEKRITVGDDYATHVAGLHRAVYAAFGHIHDPQLLPGGTATGRYAGSLVPVDFGEQQQVKQVVLVDVGDDVVVRPVELPGGRPLTQFDGELPALLARAADGGLDGHLLKARVVSDDPIPDLADQVAAASPGCALHDVVNVVRSRRARPVDTDAAPGEEPSLPALFAEWRATSANVGQRRAPDDAVVALLEAAIGAGAAPADLGTTTVVGEVRAALAALTGRAPA